MMLIFPVVLTSVIVHLQVQAAVSLEYDTTWKVLITSSSCDAESPLLAKHGEVGGAITCKMHDGIRHVKFPAGKFDIGEQVVVPANTVIEGSASPNDLSDTTKEPEPTTQTYFVATKGVTDPKTAYCGTGKNMRPGDAQRLRIGFLLNSHTTISNINYQGKDTVRPDDNGNLCGGGAFETPGCVSPGFGDGRGLAWDRKRSGCYDHTGKSNDLILGDGKGVENVTIFNVRLNSFLLPADPKQYKRAPGTQLAVWVAMTRDGSPTKNVRVKHLVSMLTRGDGINFHGNVQDSLVEDCHIENTGDDIYAAWGAYANPSGIVFKNNVGKNAGVTRDYMYGVCVAVYGAKDVSFFGTKCYDVRRWDRKCKNCNSCLAYVHDNWFGAVYPDGNAITMHNNEYLYMDGTPIPSTDRPQIRSDKGSRAHIIRVSSVEGNALGDTRTFVSAASNSFEAFEAHLDDTLQRQQVDPHVFPWWRFPVILVTGSLACGALLFLTCQDHICRRILRKGKRREMLMATEALDNESGISDEESAVE